MSSQVGYRLAVRKRLSPLDMIHQELPMAPTPPGVAGLNLSSTEDEPVRTCAKRVQRQTGRTRGLSAVSWREMRHPTRGMRDLRTTGKPAVTQDQGATEIKRHRRWDPNAAGRMPPHLGV